MALAAFGGLSGELQDLAGRLAEGAPLGASSALSAAAEAHGHLVRIRRIKRDVLQSALASIQAEAAPGVVISADEILAQALARSAEELARLSGYERKARSRRKKALRALWE